MKNEKVFRWVISKLIRGWSSEQISGRIRLVFPNNPNMRISSETIYSFAYSNRFIHRRFWEYFPRGHIKRRRRHGRKVHSASIPNRISIHDRPSIIDKNTEFGHFEGNSVESRNHKGGVHIAIPKTNCQNLKLNLRPVIVVSKVVFNFSNSLYTWFPILSFANFQTSSCGFLSGAYGGSQMS